MKTFIVDDERLARNELKRLLKNFSAIEIIGEAANADEAIERIEQARPDLLFLDIQMPGRDGFELLESLIRVPRIIFTTAFDEYALKAFEVGGFLGQLRRQNFNDNRPVEFHIPRFINCSLSARADFFKDFILVYLRANHIRF